jgi:hypothetical protein
MAPLILFCPQGCTHPRCSALPLFPASWLPSPMALQELCPSLVGTLLWKLYMPMDLCPTQVTPGSPQTPECFA